MDDVVFMEIFKALINWLVPSESCSRIFQITASEIFLFYSFARSISPVRSPSDAYSMNR